MGTKEPSRSEYQILVEQAPVLIWPSNATAECDYLNERWLQFRGRSLEQEYGNQWAEGVHPDGLQRCVATYLDAFRKREPFENTFAGDSTIDLDALRGLARMNDQTLTRFGRAAAYMCTPEVNFDNPPA
jgi:hypothetical protein